jgi:hypothetical protein
LISSVKKCRLTTIYRSSAPRPAAALLPLLGLLLLAGLAVGLDIFGKFPHYYTWTPLIAAGLCAAICWSNTPPRRLLKWTALGLLTLSIAAGYPRRVAVANMFHDDQTNARTVEFVKAHISSSARVIYAAQAYYAVKPLAARAYYYNWYPRIITPEEASQVTALIIQPKFFESLIPVLGGHWEPVSEPFHFKVRRFPKTDLRLNLIVYRNVKESPNL